jgi:hypothetical protein
MSKYHALHQIEKVTELVNELTQIPVTSTSDPDEIRQIRSTGQAIAQCLSSLGSRLAALADHSFECRAEIFKSTDYLEQTPPVQPMTVNHYIAEDNHEEVDTCTNASRPEMMADRLPNQPRPQRNEPNRHQTGQSNWRELADFFVSFGFCANQDGEEDLCTRVYHSQLDESAQWPGIALDQLLNWLLQQAGLSRPTKSEAQAMATPPAHISDGQATVQRSTPLHSTSQDTLGLKALLPSIRKPEIDNPRGETRLSRTGLVTTPVQTRLSQPLSPPNPASPPFIQPIRYPIIQSTTASPQSQFPVDIVHFGKNIAPQAKSQRFGLWLTRYAWVCHLQQFAFTLVVSYYVNR